VTTATGIAPDVCRISTYESRFKLQFNQSGWAVCCLIIFAVLIVPLKLVGQDGIVLEVSAINALRHAGADGRFLCGSSDAPKIIS
jgi:hypothetical protein